METHHQGRNFVYWLVFPQDRHCHPLIRGNNPLPLQQSSWHHPSVVQDLTPIIENHVMLLKREISRIYYA